MPAKYFIKFLIIFFVLLSFVTLSHAMGGRMQYYTKAFNEARKYYDEGFNYFKAGEYEKAVEAFKKATEIRPDYADAYYWLGNSYKNLGESDKKVESFKKAIELFSENIKFYQFNKDILGWDDSGLLIFDYYWLASSYAELGQYENAIEALKEAIKLKADDADNYVTLAFYYEKMGQDENAIKAYHDAVKLKPDDPTAYGFLVFNYRRTGQYDKAIEVYKKIIKLKPDDASPYSGLGYVYMELKQYEKAIEAFKKAISINPDAHYDIGFVYFDMKQYDDAIKSFDEALKIRPENADLHYTFASVYSSIGKLNDAIIHLKIAQNIYNKSSNKAGEAKCLYAMGLASSELNKDIDALNYFQKALTIYNELSNMKEAANMLMGIAGVYSFLQEYDTALIYQQKALENFKQINDFEYITLVLGDIARIKFLININSKDNKETIKFAEQAIEIAKLHNLQNTFNIYTSYFALTLTYIAEKDYDRALAYAEKLLSISQQYNIVNLMAFDLFLIGAIHSEKEDYQQAQTYFQKAANFSNEITDSHTRWNLYHGLGYLADKLGDNTEAKKQYLNAINILETSRENAQSLAAKISLAINASGVYENTILFLVKIAEHDEAFNYMERAKARTFLDLLGSKFKLQDKNIFEEERRLQFRINYLTEKIREAHEKPDKKNSQMEIALEKQLNTARTEYAALLEEIKKETPELSTLLTVNPLTLKDVQELLDIDTTLLEYFITPDKTLLWVVDRSDLKVIEIDIKDKELKEKVDTFRGKISNLKPEYSKNAEELYELLIKPAKPYIKTKRIGIVPHSVLHYLPFHALLNTDKFLIEEYEMFYIPSASVLKFVYEKRKEVKGKVLAFGNPDIGDESLNLPYAEDEVKKIKDTYPESVLYLKENATEGKLKTLSGNYNIIHFASHGELNPDAPLFSSIRLAKDKDEDGRLEVNEIFNLNLKNTSLVTLSACETAMGKLTNGDELVGLTRGFIYAGTPSIVASLWNVNDQSTSELMNLFYENLKTHSKSESLRMAQLEMIRGKMGKGIIRGVGGITSSKEGKSKQESSETVNGSHPYFWAPFILVGDWK